jgi:apolipoprotein D and lipocalin family protein
MKMLAISEILACLKDAQAGVGRQEVFDRVAAGPGCAYIGHTMITRQVLHMAAASAVLLLLASCATPPGKSTAGILGVKSIDMGRYLGRWYEISRIPVPIGRSWVNTSDSYSLRPDGRIAVVYEGFAGSPKGPRKTLTGRQWIPDPAAMGDMKVSFLPLLVNDNRIIALDTDYSWLVVTSSTKDYLWIMSRTPTMDTKVYDSIVSTAKGWGFDTSRLEKVRQEWD